LPRTWSELLDFAKRGLVVFPAMPVDSLMHFYMCCCVLGEPPFQQPEKVVNEEIGVRALRMLRELLSFCDPACLRRNPIANWELLSTSEKVAYCPFAYGYSNYCRRGYSSHVLQVGGLVSVDGHHLCRSTLGGAGWQFRHNASIRK
jgi:multiple sugar transport system substrate-binding protein